MTSPQLPASRWPLGGRIAFRFFAVLSFLWFAPGPLGSLPWLEDATAWYGSQVERGAAWVGEHLLGIAGPIGTGPNGSGDRMVDWVWLGCTVVLAAIATGIWSAVDRRRPDYRTLHDRVRIFLRYTLAMILLSYGLVKVIQLQFPAPGPVRLMHTYGDSSPMGLLWTFMGASRGYNLFTGAAECLGGLLLFSRRTTTLGGLIAAAVMANVVALNFCYDVPVKIFSTQLLLTALFLAAPDARRLVQLLVRGGAVGAPASPVPFRRRWLERARPWLGAAMAAWILWSLVTKDLERQAQGDAQPSYALQSAWLCELFVVDGETRPLSFEDRERWELITLSRWRLRIASADRTGSSFSLETDEKGQTIKLYGEADAARAATTGVEATPVGALGYTVPDADHAWLMGTLQGKSLMVRLRRIETGERLLVSRGFHWVNEVPFNR